MPEDMNLSINGQSQVPPGFRFHPTEEELLHYYLRKKVAFEKIDLDVIREVDLNKLEPWDIQETCKIGSTPQNDWYFFSHKDKKYPTGTRTNRATAAGFWKATGRDKIIYSSFRRIGLRKTLVFYKGRAPHGQKSDWIMHEYRLDDGTTTLDTSFNGPNPIGEAVPEEGWVVCRVFRKKNYQKTLDSPKCSSSSLDSKSSHHILSPGTDGFLDQILLYMGRTCKTENDTLINHINTTTTTLNNMRFLSSNNNIPIIGEGFHDRFMHLPRLDSPSPSNLNPQINNSPYPSYEDILADDQEQPSPNNNSHPAGGYNNNNSNSFPNGMDHSTNWVTLDRLVASQLNGTQVVEASKQLSSCFNDPNDHGFGLSDPEDNETHRLPQLLVNGSNQASNSDHGFSGDNDLWSFTKSSASPSSSDPLCHLSV